MPVAANETLTSEDLVSAYNSVFAVRGGAAVAKNGRQVQYVEDLLRRVTDLGADPFRPLDLEKIRSLPKAQLVRLLFKAVAGSFIAGPSSLRRDVCRLQADPLSGTLELYRDGGENEVVLIVISLILLLVLFMMLHRQESARTDK